MEYRAVGAVGYLTEGLVLLAFALLSLGAFGGISQSTTTPQPSVPVPSLIERGSSLTVELVAAVPLLLVSLTWFSAGRDKRSGLLTATGVIGLIVFASLIALGLGILSFFQFSPGPSSLPPSDVFGRLTGVIIGFLIIGVLAVAYAIMEIFTLFKAGEIFESKLFRYAGWGRLGAIIAAIAILLIGTVAAVFSSFSRFAINGTSTQTARTLPAGFLHEIGLVYVVAFLILSIPNFIAFEAFRRAMPEDSTPATAIHPPNPPSPAAA